MNTTGYLFRPHASEMMRQRGIAQLDLLTALGPTLVDDGHLNSPTATTVTLATPGRPVLLGWQAPDREHRDRRELLLTRTTGGRHFVVVGIVRRASLAVVTVWEQDAQPHLWRSCRLVPTELGRRTLPPTYWCASRQWDSTEGAPR